MTSCLQRLGGHGRQKNRHGNGEMPGFFASLRMTVKLPHENSAIAYDDSVLLMSCAAAIGAVGGQGSCG